MSDDSVKAREEAIALLLATHAFPVLYDISIIAVSGEVISARVRAAVEETLLGPLDDDAYDLQPSRGGRYLSHRFRVPCPTPEDVIALYERVRRVDGVVTVI
jgi:putative lipoic acid-binding regulatory protein